MLKFAGKILIIIMLLIIVAEGGVKVTSYSENSNHIIIRLTLEPYGRQSLSVYMDEGNPGAISLPSRNIILGIPYGGKPDISYNILKENTYNYFPSFNPETVPGNSRVIYNQSSGMFSGLLGNAIRIKGFLWVGNIYCINLEIQQCIFNDYYRQISEIEEIEIILKFNMEIGLREDKPLILKNSNHIILNYNEALKYSEKRPLYGFNTSCNWIDYNKNYIKIKTASEGIYRISYSDIQNAGASMAGINPSTINLYSNGKKIPVYISGEGDHVYNEDDFIEFVGDRNYGKEHRRISNYNEPYNEYIERYSDTVVYWLTWGDYEVERVNQSAENYTCDDTLFYYSEVIHVEQDNWFDYSSDILVRREYPFWTENKTWGWHALGVGTRSYDFNVSDVIPGNKINIYSKLQSYASTIPEKSHLIGIGINEDPVVYDSGYVNRNEQKVLKASLNSEKISNGKNKLKIFSFPTASTINTLFFDWYEIEYPRRLRLSVDSLVFSFSYIEKAGLRNIKIKNAVSQDYIIWKRGAWYNRFIPGEVLSTGDIIITDSVSSDDRYFIITEEKINSPLIERIKKFTNLRESRQRDYLLITHRKFLQEANKYKDFIEQSYNLKAEVINVEDIYDEFTYGFFNPEAIQSFLKSVYTNWELPLPQYVFLVGDGTYDYHRNKEKNLGSPAVENYVPSYGSPVSDNWYVTWDTTGAYIPVMNIGRLPITNAAEFNYYLEKHRTYINRQKDDWNKRYLFFSGGLGSNEEELEYLRSINEQIINECVIAPPVGGNPVHFYKTLEPVSNYGPYSSSEINNALDSSGLFLSYIGHSGTQTWDNGIVDPSQLANHNKRYPLITDFGCSTGKFAEPDVTSFAEMFINTGEAIVYIGNSSLGFFSTSTLFPGIFYKKILRDSVYCISEAHKLAKTELLQRFGSSGAYGLFALTSTFFGDPVLKLPVPDKPDLSVNSRDIKFNVQYADDRMDSMMCTVNLFNLGKVNDDSLSFIISHKHNDTLVNEETYKLPVPLYRYSMDVKIPVKDKPGLHYFFIQLDPDNNLSELSEKNNKAAAEFYVSDSDLRLLNNFRDERSILDTLEILNPVSLIKPKIILELSKRGDYSDKVILQSDPGKFSTKFNLIETVGPGRCYVRGRTSTENAFSFTGSIFIGSDYDFLVNDSAGLKNLQLTNLKTSGNILVPDSVKTVFTVISAGFNDGKTAVISKNGQTFVPGGNTIGHHVCVFRDGSYEFVDYKRFNVFGGTPDAGEYYKYIDTLSSDYLLLAAVNDEGRVPDSLKRKLHEFGSIYIDSLRFRSSWAFIGKRGAPAGSVPEAFSHPFNGKVQIDTAIVSPSGKGSFVTQLIGPAASWDNLVINRDSCNVILVGNSIQCDTLFFPGIENNTLDLSFVNSNVYPFIKISGDVHESDSLFLGVNYNGLPEIVMDYSQSPVRDTIIVGENIPVNFELYNAGESCAKYFNVVSVVNNKDTVLNRQVSFLGSKEILPLSFSFPVNEPGSYSMRISADDDNAVSELYEENNALVMHFFAKPDTAAPEISVTFDGSEVYDGDFVSRSPVVRAEISGNWSSAGNNSLNVFLDDLPVDFELAGNAVTFNPELSPGEHVVKVSLKYLRDVISCVKKVIVHENTRLFDVYNYPNPFSNDTHFIFTLTGVPDELNISIYTIAGRMVRKIKVFPPDLRTGFNTIPWDGRDENSEPLANGIYLYKISLKHNGKTDSVIQKMAVVR